MEKKVFRDNLLFDSIRDIIDKREEKSEWEIVNVNSEFSARLISCLFVGDILFMMMMMLSKYGNSVVL